MFSLNKTFFSVQIVIQKVRIFSYYYTLITLISMYDGFCVDVCTTTTLPQQIICQKVVSRRCRYSMKLLSCVCSYAFIIHLRKLYVSTDQH